MSKLSEEKIDDLSREMVKGGKSVNWLCRAIETAVLEELAKQKPAYTFHLDSTGAAYLRGECVSKEGDPLYAAPVVQPDMVLVPREPTEAMLDAAMNRYHHISPEAKARYTQMHRENFRWDYKAMIAAAEGKSNARLTVAEPVGRASDSTRKLDIGD